MSGLDSDDEEMKSEVKGGFTPNPKELDGSPDLSQLIYLEMPHVLHNLHHRYSKMARKHCYTSISTILVAINPYERLPIYGQDVIEEFHNAAKKGVLPRGRPHPYGVSARAYLRMIQRKCNQSVIVCGESGAGKTETTKLLMRYLAMTAPRKMESVTEQCNVERQIIAASPILEAYGNAKTVMNNNSSRFGKFTKLLYEVAPKAKEGYILGSYLETYLLEKSRVVFQSKNERNYHIFYFLHKGLEDAEKKELELSDPSKFHYTNQGGSNDVSGIKDVERFEELVASLKEMRIESEMKDLWRITAGILHLGNVEFKREGDGFATVKNRKVIETVARLWAVNADALETRLTTNTMRVGRGRSAQTVVKKVKFDDAVANRDSIAKGFFEQCFLYLCQRINAELYEESDEEKLDDILFIGILDVFGFENFYNNSLEQFCINFTNEKLQQFFNFHIIRSEQEEYIKEGVFWTPLSIPDNIEYIQMVETNKTGFFALLDSACKAPSPTVAAWQQELFKRHGTNSKINACTQPGAGNARGAPRRRARPGRTRGAARFVGFLIKHFADDVSYDASKFLAKNMEAVHPDTKKMLDKSKNALVSQVASVGVRPRSRKMSVVGAFHKGIRTLMKNLKQTEPFFVRCVNPNGVKSSSVWDEKVVESQLRCGGMIEALRVLALGYPTRIEYALLYEKFHPTTTNKLIKSMGPQEFSAALLIAFDVSEDDYELGLTKIFFKPAKAAILETIMAHAGKPLTPEQNEKITKWIVQKRIKQIVGIAKAFVYLRNSVRMTRAAKRWERVGRVSSLVAHSVVRHLRMARVVIKERKRQEGAVAMQSFFRSCYERKRHVSKIAKMKKATKVIWMSYQRMNERKGLSAWLDEKVTATKERKKKEEAARAAAIAKAKAEQDAAAVKLLEEKLRKEAEEAAEKERTRLRAELEEKQRQAAAKAAAEEKKKAEEAAAKQKELEENARIARERQDLVQKQIAEARAEAEAARLAMEAEDRGSVIIKKQEDVAKAEGKRKRKKAKKKRRKIMPELSDDEDDELASDEKWPEDDSSDDESSEDFVSKLANFKATAALGQYFSKYRGTKRSRPQQRVVKVEFGSKGNPKRLTWGTGSRHLLFSDILYVAHGHWTPTFATWKDSLDEQMCLSVVTRDATLDLCSDRKKTVKLWTHGLRKLIKQTEEEAMKLAKENWGDGQSKSFFANQSNKRHQRKQSKITSARYLSQVQRDLFVLSRATVLREMLAEHIVFNVDDPSISQEVLYTDVLSQNVSWKSWQPWIRSQILARVVAVAQAVPVQPQQPQYAYAQPPPSGYGHVSRPSYAHGATQSHARLPSMPSAAAAGSYATLPRAPVQPVARTTYRHLPATKEEKFQDEKCSLM